MENALEHRQNDCPRYYIILEKMERSIIYIFMRETLKVSAHFR